MNPPLRLERYFYTKIVCLANPEFKPANEGQTANIEFQSHSQVMRHAEDERRWQVVLDLKTPTLEESGSPYELDFQIVGFFQVSNDYPADNMEKLVGINGTSMLYSSARDFVMTISSRGPWPPIFLPTVSYGPPSTPAAKREPKKQQKKGPTKPKSRKTT